MPNVDLQVVSVDPGKPEIKKSETTFIEINIKNNGPDPIPKGEAVVHATINIKCLSLPNKYNFQSLKRGQWEVVKKGRAVQGQVQLWFKNSSEIPVNEQGAGVRFDVKGKAYGTADITVASSLSGTATSSDFDGANQSASTQLIVKKVKG